jgi:hypothetical protein
MSQRMASERELTAKAVRLFHLAWVVQRVRGARMFVMEEDGKLRSYGFALRRHSSPCTPCTEHEDHLHLWP